MASVTEATTEPSAADLITAVAPFLEGAASQLFEALGQVGKLAQDILDSRIVCFQCFTDHTTAQRAGIPEGSLPPLNVANLIRDGRGVCFNHAATSVILLPGQR